MKKIKRLIKLAIVAGIVYAIYQRLKAGSQGHLPEATSSLEEPAVEATESGYEIDESKLGGEVSQDLLEILVCPDDKQKLEYVDGKWLVCHTCGRRYPIVDGIPVMLIEVGDKYRNGASVSAEATAS